MIYLKYLKKHKINSIIHLAAFGVKTTEQVRTNN